MFLHVHPSSNFFMIQVDEDMYPEYYRKSSDHIKGSNSNTPEPFCIGRINGIVTRSKDLLVAAQDICLKITKFYRPENTHKGQSLARQVDLQLLYWSNEGMILYLGSILRILTKSEGIIFLSFL